jgi:hypothetical protein
MAPSDNQALDDGLLRQYLLGALAEADAERLHELSVADDAFAGRLDAIENDLVDAYVRGELSEENLKQFKSFYLSSPKRREKVRLAEGFKALELRAMAAPAISKGEPAVSLSPRGKVSRDRSRWRLIALPQFAFQWGFAVASLGLLVAGSYLLFQNVQLRKQITQAQTQHGAVDQRAEELERLLEQERAAKEEALKELEHTRPWQTNLDQLKTVSVLLPPPMRGAGSIPTISLRRGTDLVVLVLPLEADDFAAYQAKLKDPVANRVLWSSARLAAASGGERKTVSISFRAGLLKPQNYVVDLTGIPSHGPAEVISGYPFRVVLQ